MSVKIKVSYDEDWELAEILRLLSPVLKNWKASRNKQGRYKKAYADLSSDELLKRFQPER